MGFFTDAYDLFVIGIAASLIGSEWHLRSARLAAAERGDAGRGLRGRVRVGRVADLVGRKRVYWLVAVDHGGGRAGLGAAPRRTGC